MNTILLGEVDSTNLYAKRNLDNLVDKTVISADIQTCGRGRFNRVWVNLGEGNLFISIVLKPSNMFKEVYANITQYLSVVLCKILKEYGIHASIKWPNDVLIDGKKIAGILSETVMQGSNFKGLVLGIGININAKVENLSLVADKKITSLNLELKQKNVDKNLFAERLLELFFENYDEFLEKGFQYISQDYINACEFLGEKISVQVFNDRKTGIAHSINNSGELVMIQNDKEFILTMGDIL